MNYLNFECARSYAIENLKMLLKNSQVTDIVIKPVYVIKTWIVYIKKNTISIQNIKNFLIRILIGIFTFK